MFTDAEHFLSFFYIFKARLLTKLHVPQAYFYTLVRFGINRIISSNSGTVFHPDGWKCVAFKIKMSKLKTIPRTPTNLHLQ